MNKIKVMIFIAAMMAVLIVVAGIFVWFVTYETEAGSRYHDKQNARALGYY